MKQTIVKTIGDSRERELAATTFDRNVVVTAGAGTGKTTLLVDRLVHLLVRSPEPLKITEIVALTFTNKAADEMKLRLRERLQGFLAARLNREAGSETENKIQTELQGLMARYRRTKEQIDTLAREALRNIERSAIGTIHSFAAMLLRVYPIEAGLDPQFTEDDGARFERLFEEQWSLWLDRELSRLGPQKQTWKEILRKIALAELRELAYRLSAETVPLDALGQLGREAETPATVGRWLARLERAARELLKKHAGDARQIGALAELALRVIREFLARGRLAGGLSAEEKDFLATKNAGAVQGWTPSETEQARELIRTARRLLQVDDDLVRRAAALLVPLVRACREALVAQGFVSFDGLLARARDLVRDHPAVREELKRQFKAILIDEFQDTDPIQYEILLYLGERLGQNARSWRNVKLARGKLFIVGDPKQSIYAFRRADIEAYLHVVQQIIARQDGVEYQLKTNFRSHRGILDVVNGVFGKLMVARPGLQPPYVEIHPAENDPGPASGASFRKVVLRRVDVREPANADLARRLEAEDLARWLDEEVIGKATILDRHGEPVLARAKDVAFLFRKLTDIHLYLEPLRRRGIPYVVEGERHFYATQEVVDAVNLLRAVADPYDRAALVAVLRSAVGGLTDPEIYDLHAANLLDYRKIAPGLQPSLKELYATLQALHAEARALPVGEAVSLIFSRIPIEILAARSFRGAQAVANLEKVRLLAARLAGEGAASLREVTARLYRAVLDLREEGESPLAEEGVDAVRVLSVHKAKGLEFPIVVLPGCHSPIETREPPVTVQHDWSSNLIGIKIGDRWNLSGVYLAEKNRARSLEEQKRVFYVAMTRAREHLALSCGPEKQKPSGAFLRMLEEAAGEPLSAESALPLAVGSGRIERQIASAALAPPRRTTGRAAAGPPATDWDHYARLWRKRREAYARALDRRLFTSPSALKLEERELAESFAAQAPAPPSDRGLIIGSLAHRFLQAWDFSFPAPALDARLAEFVGRFPDGEPGANREAILAELKEIFAEFFSSRIYKDLCAARIVAREAPFVMPWEGQIMEGVIDLIYEQGGEVYLADYKTDRVKKETALRQAREYHHQARIYSEAARRCLGKRPKSFRLIFLRIGEAVDVELAGGDLQYKLSL